MSTTTIPLPRGRHRLRRWAPLPVILAGTFMVVLDFFIVNVALASIQHGLHAGAGAIEWVVAAYSLTSAVLLISAARLGDRHGRRRVFVAGLALFTASSVLCGLAGDPTTLVAGRLLQGAAGALLMPNVLSLISVIYDGDDRGRALAAYGLTMGLAAVSGQLIGGALVSADPAGLGWRSVFLINLPVGLVALLAAPRVIPESRVASAGGSDPRGAVLVGAALTAIVLPLVEGRQHGWPLWTWLSLAAAPVLLAALAAQQRGLARRGGAPLFPPGVLASATVRRGLVAQMVFWCGQASFFLILALYLQQGRGLSPLAAGGVFTILAVAYLAASVRAPALTERHGRRVLIAGALVLAAGHLSLLLAVAVIGVHGSIVALTPGLVLAGAGMGLGITPLTTLVMAAMAPEHAGATAGLLTTLQNVGGAIGVAGLGVVFFGGLGQGYAHAFELGLAVLALTLIAVAALARRLPAPVAS